MIRIFISNIGFPLVLLVSSSMKQILLIEDDPFLIDIYTTKLKEEGFSIEVATGGEEGLRKLREKKFDLLVLDIVLPKIDGWEILEKLKTELPKEAKVKMRTKFSSPIELPKEAKVKMRTKFSSPIELPKEAKVKMRTKFSSPIKNLKIIILSNLGQKEEVEKGLRLGANKYLIKAHYTPSEVVEEIKEVLKPR